MTQDLNIYVASLSDYNAGRLVGAWIDCENISARELYDEVQSNVLGQSKEPNAEEYAIHDHEGFDGFSVGEFTNLTEIAEIAGLIEEHGDTARAAASIVHDIGEVKEFIEDHGYGSFNSLEDFAIEMCENCGYLENVPDFVQYHIDYESMARDLLCSDFCSVELDGAHYIFSN